MRLDVVHHVALLLEAALADIYVILVLINASHLILQVVFVTLTLERRRGEVEYTLLAWLTLHMNLGCAVLTAEGLR